MAIARVGTCPRCGEAELNVGLRDNVDHMRCHAGPGLQPTLGERWDAERAERKAARASKAAAGGVDVVPVKL